MWRVVEVRLEALKAILFWMVMVGSHQDVSADWFASPLNNSLQARNQTIHEHGRGHKEEQNSESNQVQGSVKSMKNAKTWASNADSPI